MKVTLRKDYKDTFTITDLENAKKVIKQLREDETSAKEYLAFAVNEALKGSNDCLGRVLEADAETYLNGRIFNAYFEGSGRMDVWVEGIAQTLDGYIEVGAYLTDIWTTGADSDYSSRMFIRYFAKATLPRN